MTVSETLTVTVADPHGLHARPAAKFVEVARGFTSDLTIAAAGKTRDCKSLLSILSLGISQGTVVTIAAAGADEADAVRALAALLEMESQEPTTP